MPETAITIEKLTKSYGPVEAVRGIDLEVATGEVFALLGPNGAGKTTTVEILEGHRERTGGTVDVLGFDPERGGSEFRSRIGIVLQETGVERYLTVAESVDLFRGYYPSPRPVDEVLEVVGLADQRDQRVHRLSGGQQRRLDVAIGLAGDPDLLFLDEPTTGFDPSARRAAWEMVRNLSRLGKTVFLTTHYMDEAQYLADRVAIIVAGRIVAEGPPETLRPSGEALTTIRFSAPGGPPLPEELAGQAEVTGEGVTIRVADPVPALHALTAWALESGAELSGLSVSQPSLEDVYLELTRDTEGGHPGAGA